MNALVRNMLVCLLCMGLVLPKATAVLSAVLPTGADFITICTGTGIQTIRIDANGDPVEDQEITEAVCIAGHTTLTLAAYLPDFERIIRRFDYRLELNRPSLSSNAPFDPARPVRAPPVA